MRKPLALLVVPTIALAVGIGAAFGVGVARGPVGLRAFHDCGELAAYLKSHAAQAGPGRGVAVPPQSARAAPAGAADGAAEAGFSTTNVQEEGVDEPDIVKSDGSRLFAIAQGKLRAVDVTGAKPREVAALALEPGGNQQLLLYGNRLLVLSSAGLIQPLDRGVAPGRPSVAPGRPAASAIRPIASLATTLTEVDVSDPAALRVVRKLTVPGNYVTARLVGRSARVVVAETPIVELPTMKLVDRRSGRTVSRAVTPCRQIRRPGVFSGLGMVTVLTVDLAKGLPAVDSDSVLTDAQTVYASPTRLYVATQRWLDPRVLRAGAAPPAMTTTLHEFDISDPSRTDYRASGEVQGYLLNQWSLSERGGLLRVASTDAPLWWEGSPQQETQSFVTVLKSESGKLVEVGRVGDLGRGERIYAVRFIGDVGYVVTFRQTDPLYTVDLSEPARPRVLGALELLGYSAYLHPLGGDLLLGVGRDATSDGRVLGTQLSVFDVSDPRRPQRLDQKALGLGSSEVEFDHHAFLYWPPTRLTVLPVQIQEQASPQVFTGAIGFRIDRKGALAQVGRISHPEGGAAPIRRSLVVGDTLYTLSDTGLEASSLATLADRAWLPWS